MKNDVLVAFAVFQAVFFLLDLYILRKSNRDITRKGEYTYFCALIVIHLAYLVLNCAWSLSEYGALRLSRAALKILCACSLWTVTGCAFSFFLFAAEKNRLAAMRHRWFVALCSLPVLFSTALIVASPLTGWVYSVSDANQIVHGPLYMAMLMSSSLYLLGVAAIALYNMVTARTALMRQSGAALLMSVLLILAFVIIDDLLTQASILPAAIFAVILVIFINLQESNINSDALTGMNNRRKADAYLSERLMLVSPGSPLYLYMGDLDGFKGINDQYGHSEGDEALMLCSAALKQTISRYEGFAARFGGDEFLMSWQPGKGETRTPEQLPEEINALLEALTHEAEKPYTLSMSIGFTRCAERGEALSACVRRADEQLYREKERHAARR